MSDVDTSAWQTAAATIGAALFRQSEVWVRSRTQNYAVFLEEDTFGDALEDLDWTSMSFPGSNGVDLKHAVFVAEDFAPEKTTDASLQALYAQQGGALLGWQVAELFSQGRIPAAALESPTVYRRLPPNGAELTLLEAIATCLQLEYVAEHVAESQVDDSWVAVLDTVEPETLRERIGMFFQDEDNARCWGACLDSAHRAPLIARWQEAPYTVVARWGLGEGQGSISLAEVADHCVLSVPAFAGHRVIRRRRPEPGPGAQPSPTGRCADVTEGTLLEALRASNCAEARILLVQAKDPELDSLIATHKSGEPHLASLMASAISMIQRDELVLGLRLIDRIIPEASGRDTGLLEYHRSIALSGLGCHEESLAAAVAAVASLAEDRDAPLAAAAGLRPSHIYNQAAWSAYLGGEFELAAPYADKAVSADPNNWAAKGTQACVWFELGREGEAFELAEACMQRGIDLQPNRHMSEHPRHLALALKYQIPIWTEPFAG